VDQAPPADPQLVGARHLRRHLQGPSEHEFYRPDLDQSAVYGHQALKLGGDIGLRAGYYPLSFLGLELEGGIMPIKVADGSKATLYTFRPVLLAQLPYRIAPFVRAGFGMLGISSDALGKDTDPTLGIGGGVKFYINRRLLLRLDIVDNIATASRSATSARTTSRCCSASAALRQARRTPSRPAAGRHRPGRPVRPGPGRRRAGRRGRVPDPAGPAREPRLPADRQRRRRPVRPGPGGVPPENVDACPQEPGPRENQGCPLIDTDKDTLYDPGQPVPPAEIDACPNEPGPRELQGCPDRDKDKIIDNLDKCPDQPETVNQSRTPTAAPTSCRRRSKKISGVIEGIYFDVDKDTIKPRSKVVLDRAVKVLKEHPSTRWNIQGTPTPTARASTTSTCRTAAPSRSASTWSDHGIDGSRLVPQGFGPDAPIDTNATPRARPATVASSSGSWTDQVFPSVNPHERRPRRSCRLTKRCVCARVTTVPRHS
jgi:outer membrane protein OmpA-like peptidoglycan-associated protein